jgi:tetratricopeptide (TPR) repeat protein
MKKKINSCCFIFLVAGYFLFFQTASVAQTSTNDSLLNLLSRTEKISEKISLNLQLFENLRKTELTKSKPFLLSAYDFALKENNTKTIASCQHKLATFYRETRDYQLALDFGTKAVSSFAELKDSVMLGNAINNIGLVYMDSEKNTESEKNLLQALAIRVKTNDKKGQAQSYNNLSIIKKRENLYAESLDYAEKSLEIKGELNDSLGIATTYYAICNIYREGGDYEKALEYILKALSEFQKHKDVKPILLSYSQLGSLYFRYLKNNEKALETYYAALAISAKSGNKTSLENLYNNLGNVYKAMNEPDSAAKYYRLSMAAAKEFKQDEPLALAQNNLATLLIQTKNYTEALDLARTAYHSSKNSKNLSTYFNSSLTLANIFYGINNIDSALYYCNVPYRHPEINKFTKEKSSTLELLAQINFSNKNFEQSGLHYKQLLELKDSINTNERFKLSAESESKYQNQKKQQEILKLNSDKKIQQLELEKQKAVISGNFLEAKQKQNEIDLLNQQQTIQQLQLVKQEEQLTLKKLEADASAKALQLSEQEKKIKQTEVEQQRTTKNLILIGTVILLAFVMLGFNQYRINMHRKNDKEKFQLQHQLSEMKLEALRSQMNPHFIFNALNSINRYIIRSDKETASDYLVKFSKLIRLILENSKSTIIPLQNELEALRLYVEMELLRFDNKFDFTIAVDDSIDKEQLQIPPMVLQPYVENAIWHGLMNKKEKGSIQISISQKEKNKLFCTIQDNGVGRIKATELKNKTTHTGKSLGMQITSERINVLSGDDKNFKIIDLFDTQKNPSGTRVEIILNCENTAA